MCLNIFFIYQLLTSWRKIINFVTFYLPVILQTFWHQQTKIFNYPVTCHFPFDYFFDEGSIALSFEKSFKGSSCIHHNRPPPAINNAYTRTFWYISFSYLFILFPLWVFVFLLLIVTRGQENSVPFLNRNPLEKNVKRNIKRSNF